jgi:hypothetical protein
MPVKFAVASELMTGRIMTVRIMTGRIMTVRIMTGRFKK